VPQPDTSTPGVRIYKKDTCLNAEQAADMAKATALKTHGAVMLPPPEAVKPFLKAWKDKFGTAPAADAILGVVSDYLTDAAFVMLKDDKACGIYDISADDLMAILRDMPVDPSEAMPDPSGPVPAPKATQQDNSI